VGSNPTLSVDSGDEVKKFKVWDTGV
jgi:hypothetical protein